MFKILSQIPGRQIHHGPNPGRERRPEIVAEPRDELAAEVATRLRALNGGQHAEAQRILAARAIQNRGLQRRSASG